MAQDTKKPARDDKIMIFFIVLNVRLFTGNDGCNCEEKAKVFVLYLNCSYFGDPAVSASCFDTEIRILLKRSYLGYSRFCTDLVVCQHVRC